MNRKPCRNCGLVFDWTKGRLYCRLECAQAAHTEQRGAEECWPFIGTRNRAGYGYFYFGRDRAGHRTALELKLGRELTQGEVARHACDNPSCVNPAHLEAGSHKDNSRDSRERGRAYVVENVYKARGARSGPAKLTDDAVLNVMRVAAAGGTIDEVAAAVGINAGTVGDILRGYTWRHLHGSPEFALMAERRPLRTKKIRGPRGAGPSEEMIVEARARKANGESYRAIAAAMGVCYSTLYCAATSRRAGTGIKTPVLRPLRAYEAA